jgi:hypothetical protein
MRARLLKHSSGTSRDCLVLSDPRSVKYTALSFLPKTRIILLADCVIEVRDELILLIHASRGHFSLIPLNPADFHRILNLLNLLPLSPASAVTALPPPEPASALPAPVPSNRLPDAAVAERTLTPELSVEIIAKKIPEKRHSSWAVLLSLVLFFLAAIHAYSKTPIHKSKVRTAMNSQALVRRVM